MNARVRRPGLSESECLALDCPHPIRVELKVTEVRSTHAPLWSAPTARRGYVETYGVRVGVAGGGALMELQPWEEAIGGWGLLQGGALQASFGLQGFLISVVYAGTRGSAQRSTQRSTQRTA